MKGKRIKINRVIWGSVLIIVLMSLVMVTTHAATPQAAADEEMAKAAKIKECQLKKHVWLQFAIPGVGNCVSGFPEYLKKIYELFIGIVGILAVIIIMVGGFQWLMAAGNAQRISGAKTTIISAIMGLVLALTSYTILEFANPKIKNLSFEVPGVNLTERSTIGLCNPTMKPLLRSDKTPQCGKSYVLLKQDEKTGQDNYCAGYDYSDSNMICYYDAETLKTTHKVGAITTIDTRTNGFAGAIWDVISAKGELYNCGSLLAKKYEGREIFQLRGFCDDGKKCVIKSTNNIKWTDLLRDQLVAGNQLVGQIENSCEKNYSENDYKIK